MLDEPALTVRIEFDAISVLLGIDFIFQSLTDLD
jgi:hypothetical protein